MPNKDDKKQVIVIEIQDLEKDVKRKLINYLDNKNHYWFIPNVKKTFRGEYVWIE